MVTTRDTAVLLLSASLVHRTLSHRDPDGQRSHTNCGILALAGGENERHVQRGDVEPVHAPVPAPLNTQLPGEAIAAGSARRNRSFFGSKGSSGFQFAAKHALAVWRGHTLDHLGDGALELCTKDNNGERTGCKGKCQCAILERCYPKFRTESADHLDIGVCNPAVAVLVFMSILIIGNSVACMVVLRVFFQWRERIRTMMESGYHPEEASVDPRLMGSTKTFLLERSQSSALNASYAS